MVSNNQLFMFFSYHNVQLMYITIMFAGMHIPMLPDCDRQLPFSAVINATSLQMKNRCNFGNWGWDDLNMTEIMVAIHRINDIQCIDEIKNHLHQMNHGCVEKFRDMADDMKEFVTANNMTDDALKQWAMRMENDIDMSGCNPCGGKRIFLPDNATFLTHKLYHA